MSYLSTSGINSLVSSYITEQTERRLEPLNVRKDKYKNLYSAYGTLSSKLSTLKSTLSDLKLTGTSSPLNNKKTSTSNANFISAAATSSAGVSSYTIRTSQLAKSDVVMSSDLAVDTVNGVTTGSHNFIIRTGDGGTGSFTSNISVDLDASDTNEETMEKIRNAINSDLAEITSSSVSGSYSGAAGSFKINLNGTNHTINYSSGDTYENTITSIVEQINKISGVTAEKVVDGSNVSLKITVTDSSKYITIDRDNDTGEILDAANLNIDIEKEKGASGTVNASLFTPTSSSVQFSVSSKTTGLANRITELSDAGSGSALSAIGLNLGASRPTFAQLDGSDTAGFVHSDITEAGNQLNSKIEFNGLIIQRGTNSISDLVTGVTFNLHSVMAEDDTDVTLSVENNIDESKAEIKTFIDNFNAVYSYLRSGSTNNNGSRGVFSGDANALSLKSIFTSYSYQSVSGLPDEDIKSLTQIGITFDVNKGFSITDNSLLEEKLSNNPSEVEALFNSSNGIATSLYDQINPYLGTAGYLAASRTLFNNNIHYLNDRIESVNTSIDKSAAVMRKSYEQLLTQLAELYSAQSMLSTISSGTVF